MRDIRSLQETVYHARNIYIKQATNPVLSFVSTLIGANNVKRLYTNKSAKRMKA